MRVRSTDRFVKSAVPKGRKSPIFMDDEVIGFECSSFAALHEFGSGPFRLSAQPVDATQALNLSAGVSNVKVLRGRSLS